MKKILIVLLAFASISIYAQTESNGSLKSKKGKEILPQQGDFGFGVEGTQFINFVGNFFNQAGNNTMQLNLPNNGQTFSFKYVADSKTFYRAKLRLGLWSEKDREYIIEEQANIDPEETVEDIYSFKETNIELAFGIEKRKGENRLQGFYGGEVGFFMSQEKKSYEYGNDVENNFTIQSYTTNFGSNLDFTGARPMRVIEDVSDKMLGIRDGLFIGAEYFFAPKISASGEFGWNIIYLIESEGTTEYEFYNPVTENDDNMEMKSAGGSLLYIDNTPTGQLTLSLYF